MLVHHLLLVLLLECLLLGKVAAGAACICYVFALGVDLRVPYPAVNSALDTSAEEAQRQNSTSAAHPRRETTSAAATPPSTSTENKTPGRH